MFHQAARLLFRRQIRQELNILRKASNDDFSNKLNKKSLSELFFNKKIQELLKKISVFEPGKVLKLRKTGTLEAPSFEFMTDEDLAKARKEMDKKVDYYMQIPPVLDPKEDDVKVLSTDPCLEGHDLDHAKFVFTDISFNLKERERIIVVREPDGVLRTANSNERDRMWETYFPRPGRKIEPSRVFEPENMKSLFDREEYIYLLDNACAQFEPDDPKYQEIVFSTYERINEMRHFRHLESTRHFGALAFYLVVHDKMDNIILHNILSLRIEEAISLVHLYHLIHPDCQSSKVSTGDNETDILKAYIENDSKNRGELSSAFKSYLDVESSRKSQAEGIQEAHGV